MLVAGPAPSEDFHQADLQGGSQRKETRGHRWDIQTVQRNHGETLEGGDCLLHSIWLIFSLTRTLEGRKAYYTEVVKITFFFNFKKNEIKKHNLA